jgi:hypothetical protein
VLFLVVEQERQPGSHTYIASLPCRHKLNDFIILSQLSPHLHRATITIRSKSISSTLNKQLHKVFAGKSNSPQERRATLVISGLEWHSLIDKEADNL